MWKYTSKNECNEFLLSLKLLNCTDKKKYLRTIYTISNHIEEHYKIYQIPKRNGKYRTIYEPKPLLKHIQKQILTNILNNKQISKYATAYHQGLSLRDNALPHVHKKLILKLDIKDFFENIFFYAIYNNCFSLAYFPEPVGILLTNLCVYEEHLTQGSPTSAYISNLVMKEFDEEIGAWCCKKDISYTRYSDDMTFSGIEFNPSEVIIKVRKNLKQMGLELNTNKIHVVNNASRQIITGIVVNEKIGVNIQYRKAIRQEIYYIKKYGLSSHLEHKKIELNLKKYLNILYGKVLYVLQINNQDKEFQEYKDYLSNL